VFWCERPDSIEGERELKVHRLLGHNVPSLSKTAMRSACGTKSGVPCRVVRSTKSTIALLAAP
jgi:hypothetical protein